MKTQILQLDTYDDLVSACDKLKWAKADRILLVLPSRSKSLNRRLDLLILKRQSISQGAQLALVTRDSRIRSLAHQHGIPTFSTIRRAQSKAWRLPRRFRKKQNFSSPVRNDLAVYRTELTQSEDAFGERTTRKLTGSFQSFLIRLFLFTLGVLAFLTVAALLYPSAIISLKPAWQWQETNLIVIPDENAQQASIDGRIPVRKITATVEGRSSIPVSGTVLFPDTHAVGEVEFRNLTEALLEIPIGTVVRTANGNRYAVTSPGKIPAGSGETATLPVRCLLPGSSGNQPAGSIQTIEGNLSTFASASNESAFHSGQDRRMPAATQSDRQKLAEKLIAALQASALIELQDQLADGDYLIPGSVLLTKTLEEVFLPTDESPTNTLNLSLRLEYQASFLAAEDLDHLFKLVDKSTLPENREVIPGSLTYEISTAPGNNLAYQNGIQLIAKRQTREIITTDQVIALVIGSAPEKAREKLTNQYTLQSPPSIQLTPDWWPGLPFIPLRITVQVFD